MKGNEDMTYRAKLVVPSHKAKFIDHLLSDCGVDDDSRETDTKCECCDRCGADTIIYTVHFMDGRSADVKLCPGCPPWSETVLFDAAGNELYCTEPEDDFFGDCHLEYGGQEYTIMVVKEDKRHQDLFDDIYTRIASDIASNAPVCLLEEFEDEIRIVDDSELTDRVIRYIQHARIRTEWLEERILVTDSAKKCSRTVDPHALAEYLFHSVKKDFLQTLEHIVIMADVEADWDEINLEDWHGNRILDVCDLPDKDLLGIAWTQYQTVVINLDSIIRTAKEVCDSYGWDVDSEVNTGIVTTILHELVHLAQADPYLPKSALKGLPVEPEEQAETWARNTWESYGGYVLDNKKEE